MRQVRPAPVSGNSATAQPRLAASNESRFQNALSVALMAGIAFLPIVIAAGFLAEHLDGLSVPREVSTAAFRGPIDDRRGAEVLAGSERPAVRVRAGF